MKQNVTSRYPSAATFNSKEEVTTSSSLAPYEPAEQSLLEYNNEQYQLNLFTLDAIVSMNNDKYFYFSSNAKGAFPINVSTRASNYDVQRHLHKHGLLRVLNASFIGVFKVTMEPTGKGKKGIHVIWGKGHKIHIKKPEDVWMVKLVVTTADIVKMVGGVNMPLLQERIAHRIACCVTKQSAPHFPVYNFIHQLAIDIQHCCDEATESSQKVVNGIREKCQEFTKIHNQYRRRLKSTTKKESMLPYKDNMREAQKMMVATLLEIAKWSKDEHTDIQQFFLEQLHIVLKEPKQVDPEHLQATLQEIVSQNCLQAIQPIIQYHSISDIQDWQVYHTYCKTHDIKLEHHTKEDLQDHPHLFHLINRLIIEHAIAVRDEDKHIYEWDTLIEKAEQEKTSLIIITELILPPINRLCGHLQISPWTHPEDIDFKKIHASYHWYLGSIKERFKKKGKLKQIQVHHYLELIEFTLESARLGYYRIPIPAENGLTSTDDNIQALIDSLEIESELTPIFLQRYSYILCLVNLINLLL